MSQLKIVDQLPNAAGQRVKKYFQVREGDVKRSSLIYSSKLWHLDGCSQDGCYCEDASILVVHTFTEEQAIALASLYDEDKIGLKVGEQFLSCPSDYVAVFTRNLRGKFWCDLLSVREFINRASESLTTKGDFLDLSGYEANSVEWAQHIFSDEKSWNEFVYF